ncbi:DUF6412 domain-containing protein [Pseudonocardia sp. TRM90224]|uniref:DUF6412 domain-containing protein n=1 Tax=Pseudonocardia sp. TRM90224 TaxID=2812678 RepID=UPI001E507F12|nr:DUF6412 domain-containing protein [Pseudonocardia sp. TRM90224]
MRGAWVQAAALLLLGSVLAGATGEHALIVGVMGAVLVACGLVRRAEMGVLATAGSTPAITAREHHRALARRAVPRQRDPDAAGHIRSRAPSGAVPAV